ncbi:hypothetical protein K432DRAFT_404859 [Lepidopterella palustris CBS 459.81]|uniref:Uncharacterized protein n=1 Tax=Lepidopterella palustris CBS 459.81 TaxID=1314670 RepID=A0A8E2EAP5_9PEZI|nr:hypothetical protein K432DRAFT_404859 [Lepidopterella palustris CBS 459.81]
MDISSPAATLGQKSDAINVDDHALPTNPSSPSARRVPAPMDEHFWPPVGDLTLHEGESKCQYCRGKAAKREFKDIKDLFKHIKAKHVHPIAGDRKNVDVKDWYINREGKTQDIAVRGYTNFKSRLAMLQAPRLPSTPDREEALRKALECVVELSKPPLDLHGLVEVVDELFARIADNIYWRNVRDLVQDRLEFLDLFYGVMNAFEEDGEQDRLDAERAAGAGEAMDTA